MFKKNMSSFVKYVISNFNTDISLIQLYLYAACYDQDCL